MHRLLAAAIVALTLGLAHRADAQDWFYTGPAPVVTYYHAPPSPFVYYDVRPSYYAGAYVTHYAPGYYYGAAPFYYAPRKIVVRSKAFYRGQPVRNAIRAVTP